MATVVVVTATAAAEEDMAEEATAVDRTATVHPEAEVQMGECSQNKRNLFHFTHVRCCPDDRRLHSRPSLSASQS